MTVLDINGCTQPSNILCNEITEYDGAHRGFAGAALPHQEDFFLPFAGVHTVAWEPGLWIWASKVSVVVVRMCFFALRESTEIIHVDRSPRPTLGIELKFDPELEVKVS